MNINGQMYRNIISGMKTGSEGLKQKMNVPGKVKSHSKSPAGMSKASNLF